MRPIKFLLSCVFLFTMLVASYAVIVDRFVIPQEALPFPYRQFLLEATGSIAGKVVIDSGSNGIHSFDTKILSEYFQAPVIIVSDVASNPLRYKIFNFAKYLKAGDTLILPLEWGSYSSNEELSGPFVENVILNEHAYHYYINKLPLLERLRFILQKLPLNIVVDFFLNQDSETRRTGDSVLERLGRFESVMGRGDNTSFGGEVRDGPEEIDPISLFLSCDSYLFGKMAEKGDLGEVHQVFLSNLDLLEKLSEQGISIYFTWPTVVDSMESVCYGNPELRGRLEQLSASIVESVESRGFQFIGMPEDSHFDSSCFLNTYYHIRYSCSIARTKSFVESLSNHSVYPLGASISEEQVVEVFNAYIESKRQQILEDKAKELPFLSEGVVSPADHEKKLLFRSGWSGTEEKGTWSIGKESNFQIRIDSTLLKQEYVYLGIDGNYYNGAEKTEVQINGISYGARVLGSQFFKVPSKDIFDQTVVVRLRHSDVRSPKMLGKGEGTRMIKFRLREVSLSKAKP